MTVRVLYSTVQYSFVQHRTALQSTAAVQCNTLEYSTVQRAADNRQYREIQEALDLLKCPIQEIQSTTAESYTMKRISNIIKCLGRQKCDIQRVRTCTSRELPVSLSFSLMMYSFESSSTNQSLLHVCCTNSFAPLRSNRYPFKEKEKYFCLRFFRYHKDDY
jgi:hypothetical protein